MDRVTDGCDGLRSPSSDWRSDESNLIIKKKGRDLYKMIMKEKDKTVMMGHTLTRTTRATSCRIRAW